MPVASLEQPSAVFLAKLKSAAAAGHRVEARLAPSLYERRSWLGVINAAGLTPEMAKLWEVDRRYSGPCSGLVVVFWSRLVRNSEGAGAVEVYELLYRGEADAQRVAGLLLDAHHPWDWNYRPFAVARSPRSVIIVEGRPAALPAFRRVAEHFGAHRADAPAAEPWPRPCDPEAEPKPIDVTGGESRPPLSVFALGFSASGRFAWLEQRPTPGGPGTHAGATDWSLQVTDLVDDRRLLAQTFAVKRKGLVGLCASHGRELAKVLADNKIDGRAASTLEQPRPSKDPVAVEVRRARAENEAGQGPHDLILRGHAGSKRIASLVEGEAAPGENVVGAPKVLGIVRSPFEQRVAVAVTRETLGAQGSRKTVVQFFGGRLDKGWKADAPR